jgi:peptidoglycan/LPS O-acetylase OafA/YrhL/O-antigen ligase
LPAFVLSFIWILWPLLTFAGGLGLGSLAGLAALVCSVSAIRGFKPRLYLLPLLAFFVFCGVSAMWSPREMALVEFDFSGMKFAVRSEMLRVGLLLVAVGALIAAATRLTDERRRLVARIASAGLLAQLVVVVLLAAFEADALQVFAGFMSASSEGVQNISRNALLCAVAAPVFALGVAGDGKNAGRLIAAGAILAGAIFAAWYRDVQAGLLAMALAAAAASLVALFPRRGFFLLAIAFSAVIMTAPWALDVVTQGADYASADSSSSYRAAIWQHVIGLIHEQPVLGNGIGVLRTIKDPIESGVFAGQLMVPNHSHNMLLQLWVETGAVGAGLLSLSLLLVGWRLSGGERKASALRGAALAGGVFAIACVSFDLWNDMFWAASGLIALLIVCTPRLRQRAEAPSVGIVFGEGPSLTVPSENSDLTKRSAAPASSAARDAQEPATGEVGQTEFFAAHTHNNFNLLRLLFALMVVVYHAIALANVPSWQGAEQATSLLAELGVQGFFVLSGYLVFASLQRSNSIGLYAQKRARRLLPGYAAVVLLCAAGALAFSPAAREDLAAVARYLGWNLVFLNFMEPNLPGVFEANRFSEINGALWTLKIEVMFYLVLPMLAFFMKLAGGMRWVLFVLVYIAAEAWRASFLHLGQAGGGIATELARQLPGQMSFFIVGIALAAWRDDINWRSPLAPIGIVLLALSIAVPEAMPLRAIGLGVTSVWVATAIPRLLDPARFGDLSYGVYIVHFPIIQVAVAIGLFAASPWIGAAVAIAAALVCAMLLWWLVERPALRADSAYRRT